ncbi:MAG: hypothetical protein ACLS8T_34685 [Anaerobutyricum sp.]
MDQAKAVGAVVRTENPLRRVGRYELDTNIPADLHSVYWGTGRSDMCAVITIQKDSTK